MRSTVKSNYLTTFLIGEISGIFFDKSYRKLMITGREPLPGKSGDELHIEVPLSAVASPDGSESYVWVIDESTGTVHRRTVTLGGMTTRGLLVGGLEADLWIATAGVHYLQEGQRVRILAAARESPR